MNLLIVDDEVIAIQGIINSINWDKLPNLKAYTANSYSQAIDIFNARPVDIMLCDIEMPHQNGLDLIEWVNRHSHHTINIIISCHSKFDFAKQALRLDCMDYLLKPVAPEEITKILQDAIALSNTQTQQQQYHALGKNYVQSLAQASSGGQSPMENVKEYILGNIDDDLSVDKLAKQFHFHPDYLSRAFKKQTGKNILEFVSEYRLSLAAQLLRDTDIPLVIVAERVGYKNYSYFIKKFREQYEVSPRQFRSANKL